MILGQIVNQLGKKMKLDYHRLNTQPKPLLSSPCLPTPIGTLHPVFVAPPASLLPCISCHSPLLSMALLLTPLLLFCTPA